MTCGVDLKNVSLRFRLYKDKNLSLKEFVLSKFKRSSSKGYEDFYALKNIDLSFTEGERIGLIGLNGAGKSTMLKSIAKIYSPQEGEISIRGKIVPLLELGAGFNPEFTGRENVYLNGAMLGVSRKEMLRKEREIIEFSELEEFIDMPVKHYSSGMYARLAFTIATAVEPEILILDEIFAGGDAHFVEKAKTRLDELIRQSKIVFLVSHRLDLIESICNRVIILDHGVVMKDGTTSEALEYYHNNILKKN